MALKRRRDTLSGHDYAVLRGKIPAELDRLLSGTYTDPDNARLAKLRRTHRDSVLRFLDHDKRMRRTTLPSKRVVRR